MAEFQAKVELPRPVNAFGMSLVTGGMEHEFHSHRRAQLFFLLRGEVTCEASNALWIVPPRSALWIPGGVSHRVKGRAPLEGYAAFIEPDAAPSLPSECRAVSVSPLLRELVMRAAELPEAYASEGSEARLVAVLLDELSAARVEKLCLPMPVDARLRTIAEALTKNPADGSTLQQWAKRVGMAERTLNRMLVRETGLSFGRWRQQLHIVLALQWLARGTTVHCVSVDLGYESPSSFVTMFKKAFGTSPARYMAQRLERPDSEWPMPQMA